MNERVNEPANKLVNERGNGPRSDPQPVLLINYAQTRHRENLFGLIGFGIAAICASLPARMLWQLGTGQTRKFVVYKPYAADIGILHLGVNWPWFALDVIALLLGIVGIYLGGRRWSIAAVLLASLSLVTVMTLVLGSPW